MWSVVRREKQVSIATFPQQLPSSLGNWLPLKRYQCLLTEPRKRECETVFFSFDQHSSIKGLIQEWEDENQQFLILVWQIMKFMLETVFRWNISLYDNCQRPVFSPGVSQHMHKIINLSKFSLIGRRSCENKNGRKNTPVAQVVCFNMLEFETSAEVSKSTQLFYWEITSFSKTTLP